MHESVYSKVMEKTYSIHVCLLLRFLLRGIFHPHVDKRPAERRTHAGLYVRGEGGCADLIWKAAPFRWKATGTNDASFTLIHSRGRSGNKRDHMFSNDTEPRKSRYMYRSLG